MSTISTHILDTALGVPASGVRVVLEDEQGGAIGSGTTGPDGRIKNLADDVGLPAGTYRLRFAVDEYFIKSERDAFYPEIVVLFRVADGEHHHVPLLLSPYGYSTYRGS